MITGYFFTSYEPIHDKFPLIQSNGNLSNVQNTYAYNGIKFKDAKIVDNPVLLSIDNQSIKFFFRVFKKEENGLWEFYNFEKILDLSYTNDDFLHENIVKVRGFEYDGIENKQSDILRNTTLYEINRASTLISYKISPPKDNQISAADILLDFLFDFFYSNVFLTNPQYDTIKSKLEKHPLTKALLAKLNYYYFRECLKNEDKLIEAQKKECLKNEDNSNEPQKRYYEKQLEKSTKTWLSLIRNKDYEKIIHPDNKWFEPIESEHFNVFYQGEEPKEKTLKDKLWYAFPKPIQILLKKNKRTLSDEAEKSVQWLLERYHLWGAFVLQFGYIRSKLHFGGILMFTILFSTIVCMNHNFPINFSHGILGINENLLTNSIVTQILFFVGLTFSALLLAVGLVEAIYGFLASIRSFFNLIKIEEKIYENFLPSRSISKWLLSIPKLIEFFKPKILISSAVVWTFLFTNEQFWNLDFKIGRLEKIVIIILLFSAFSFMASIFKPLLPIRHSFKQMFKITRRAGLIVILGLLYSFIIGVSIMSFMAKNVLTRNDYLQNYFLGYYENIETREIAKEYANRLPSEMVEKMNLILLPENQETGDKLTYKNIKKLIEPVNKDKKLFEDVLPYLKQKNGLKSNVMIEGYINLNFGRQELSYERNLYIFPDMLFFYTFITLLIGIFAEMGFGKRE